MNFIFGLHVEIIIKVVKDVSIVEKTTLNLILPRKTKLPLHRRKQFLAKLFLM